MPRFSKTQMLDELREIFLFKGDDLLLSFGRDFAGVALGFPPGRNDEYCNEPPERVDLSRFPISRAFEEGYDFAFRPTVLNGALSSDVVQDLAQFATNLPSSGGVFSAGELHPFMTQDGLCRTLVDALYARWKLEWDNLAGHTFTTRELALLADMTEGAVRNALADKSESGLRAIVGSKPLSVDQDEAARWLSERRGFVPTPTRAREDRYLNQYLANIQLIEAFSKLLRERVIASHGSAQRAAEGLGWTESELMSWCNGTYVFDIDKAVSLARALDIEPPLVAGKALELALRRMHGDPT